MSPKGLYFKYFHGPYAVSLRRCYPWQRHGKARYQLFGDQMDSVMNELNEALVA